MSNETKDANNVDLSRRNMLKLTAAGLLAGAATSLLSHPRSAHAAETGPRSTRVLIVYYTRSGNTREIASQIHQSVGGDIVEIQTVEPYPDDYDAVTKQAKQELNSGYKPPLKTKVENLGSYNVVFLGSPIWWSTIASPVRTFLSENDLSGKTILPFVTHAGSALGKSVADIAALCPNSTVSDGLTVWGRDAKTAPREVAEWLRRIGMKK
jgi:flavodoxin